MNWLINSFSEFGQNRIFVRSNSEQKSYQQLFDSIIENQKRILNDSIQTYSTVAIVGDYCFDSISMFLALYLNKNIVVPITSNVQHEIDYRIEEGNVEYIYAIDNKGIRLAKRKFDNNKKEDFKSNLVKKQKSGLILFSSGSSGRPKAMIHDLDNLIDSFHGKKSKELNFLVFLMFDHIGGLNTLLNCLSMGVSITLPKSRDPEHICELIEDQKVNVLPASPTFLNLILLSEAYQKHDLSSLRLITYGTEPMPESLLVRLKEAFPRVKFLQTFGTSETGIAQVSSKSSTSNLIKFDDPKYEYKIIENELWLKSKTQVMGYLNADNDRFTSDGWFKTGDIVEQHENGYLRIVGRNSDLINVGGLKVLPSEVESVLLQMEQVADCMVFSKANPITGQIVAAQIVLKREMSEKDFKKQMRLFCKERLDNYKIPVAVEIVEKSNYSDRFKKIRRWD